MRTTNGKFKQCNCIFERSVRQKLPPLYHEARLTDFRDSITSAIIGWLAKPSQGLFIFGGTGTGKTHLAAGIVRAAVNAGTRVLFKRAADLFQEIRASYKSTEELSESQVLDQYTDSPLLILDDFGSGSFSDFERQKSLDLLDVRGNWQRPTVITSNWEVKQLGEKMGDDRIGSRLASFNLMELAGADRRTSLNPSAKEVLKSKTNRA